MKLKILQTFGVTTTKYSACVFKSNSRFEIDVPFGCSVVRWNLEEKKRAFFKQIHKAIVVHIEKLNNHIISASENGEIKVFKGNEYEEIFSFKIDQPQVFLKSVSSIQRKNRIDITGCFDSFHFSDDHHKHELLGNVFFLRIDLVEPKNNTYSEKTNSNGISYDYSCFFNQNQEDSKANILAIEQKRKNSNSKSGKLFEKGSKVIKICLPKSKDEYEAVLDFDDNVSAFKVNKTNEILGIALKNGKINLISLSSLKIIHSIDSTKYGKGLFQSLAFDTKSENFYAVNNQGKMISFNLSTKSENLIAIPSNVHFFAVHETLKETKKEKRLKGGEKEQTKVVDFFFANESKLSMINTKEKLNNEISYIQMVGCGIDLSLSSPLISKEGIFENVAVGDLLGNVFLFKNNNFNTKKEDPKSHEPVAKCFVGNSVRSLCFEKDTTQENMSIQIGCFDGSVYNWKPNSKTGKNEVTRSFSTTSGINCMSWETSNNDNDKTKNSKNSKLFAAGTSGGDLMVFEKRKYEDFMRIKLSIKAHKPWRNTEHDNRFGSIKKFAECWSLAFSPSSEYIITCSEDQTSCIWKIDSGEKIHTFQSHNSAVTCVKWMILKIGEVIVTCGDDKRVIVWINNAVNLKDKTKWSLYHVFNSDLLQWHTLTYLEIIKEKQWIICTTQHGHVIVFDLLRKKLLSSNKLHRGSIEGLCCNPKTNTLATISADCCVNLFQYKPL